MKLLLPAALAAILAAIPSPVSACAAVGPDGSRIDITSEAALIVWDEANRMEHFIRRASFESSAYDFGFLVPTPSLPEIAESDDEVFTRLTDITKPKIEYRTRTASIGCVAGAKFASEAAGKSDGVMVLQAGRVGDHDVVSLKFEPKAGSVEHGSQALADWLVRFGYGFGTTLKEWVEPYVKNGWVITAFRIAGQKPEEPLTRATGRSRGRDAHGLRAKPVRLSFKTDRPFYPYREPADMRLASPSPHGRILKVYFVADKRFSGTIGDSAPFPGRIAWSDTLQDAERIDVIAKAKLPADAGPKAEWRLTEFEDRSSPRPGTDEVYFAPSADQSAVARPPIIHDRETFTPWYIGLAVCFGLPAITFLLLAIKRRAA
ncbi:MAG: DUF2330 domain-containing protein [Gemmataceae bacterium]